MRQCRALILDEEDILGELKSCYIVLLSKNDSDNLKLLQQYLPKDLTKKEFTEQEKEAIDKYNSYIDLIKSRSKSSSIQIDFGLKKIVY